jgi:hypothetical protein
VKDARSNRLRCPNLGGRWFAGKASTIATFWIRISELFRQPIQSLFCNLDEILALHPSPLTQIKERSLRVAVVFVFILVIFFAVSFVFLFVFFLVGLLSNEDIGKPPIRMV